MIIQRISNDTVDNVTLNTETHSYTIIRNEGLG